MAKAIFRKIVLGNYFYVDRTQYMPVLENAGSFLMCLRPRRFGKSLTTTTLRCYYGEQYQKDFQALFGKYYIGKNPTPEANQYMILHFDFSGIDTRTEESTFEGFLNRARKGDTMGERIGRIGRIQTDFFFVFCFWGLKFVPLEPQKFV